MTIGKICKKKVKTINQDSTIIEAAKLMTDENVGFLVVINSNDSSPIGTLTDRDIVTQVVAESDDLNNIKVSKIMSKDILILSEDQGIQEIIELMGEREVRRAPIVNDENQLIGVVSMDDLLVLLAEEISILAGIAIDQVY